MEESGEEHGEEDKEENGGEEEAEEETTRNRMIYFVTKKKHAMLIFVLQGKTRGAFNKGTRSKKCVGEDCKTNHVHMVSRPACMHACFWILCNRVYRCHRESRNETVACLALKRTRRNVLAFAPRLYVSRSMPRRILIGVSCRVGSCYFVLRDRVASCHI